MSAFLVINVVPYSQIPKSMGEVSICPKAIRRFSLRNLNNYKAEVFGFYWRFSPNSSFRLGKFKEFYQQTSLFTHCLPCTSARINELLNLSRDFSHSFKTPCWLTNQKVFTFLFSYPGNVMMWPEKTQELRAWVCSDSVTDELLNSSDI